MGQLRSEPWEFRKLAIALVLTLLVSAVGYAQPGAPPNGAAQPSAPPASVASFLHSLVGEWVGTCVQSTDGKAAENKYFHAVIKQPGPDTYETVFEYYRLDPQTGAPLTVGAAIMTTKVAPDGTATNTITGSGQVLLDPKTSKPEQHDLSEVLRVSPSGGLEGTGSGTIKVSGMPLGAGKHGKVRDYHSTWSQSNGVLSLSQRLNVKFKVLFFSKSFAIIADYTARPGSDIVGLMKSAAADVNRVEAASPRQSARTPST
jgi:hypothetical protein